MRIILDPSREGCSIWFPDRNSLKFIKGDIPEICERIYNFSTRCDEKNMIRQIVTIVLDRQGYGIGYQDILVDKYHLNLDIIAMEKDYII